MLLSALNNYDSSDMLCQILFTHDSLVLEDMLPSNNNRYALSDVKQL